MNRRDVAAIAIVIAVVTLIFSDVLFFGRAFYFRDVTRFYYPMKKITRDIVLSGDFPSWNPYLSEGQPLAANPEFAVFYPPNWLLLLPDFELAFRLEVLLHYYLAAIGMYLFLRWWRLRIESAMFGAFAFTFGGLLLSLSNLLPYLFCLAWLPWLGLFLGRSSRRDSALASLCLALILLGGEPVTIAQILLMAVVYAFFVWRCAPSRAEAGGGARRHIMVLIAGLLVASVQIVPAADHLRDSVRARPFPFKLVSTWSTPPLKVVEMFVPGALGPVGEHAAFYWGTAAYNWLDPFFLSIYPGLLTSALALSALFLRRRGALPIALALFAGFILALGSHTPLLRLMYDVRLFSSFRYPEKFLIMAVVPLTIFAAFAFDRLIDGDEQLRKGAISIAAVAGGACLLLTLLAVTPRYVDGFIRFWGIEVHPFRATMAMLSLRIWMFDLIRAAVIVALLVGRRRMRAQIWARFAVAIFLLDLGLERPQVAETIEHEFFSQRPPTLPMLRNDVRLFHQADWYGSSGIARAYFDRQEMYWVIRNGAYPHVNAAWGIESALNRDIDQTALLPTAELLERMKELRPRNPRWFEPLIAMSNAGYRAMYLPLHQAGRGKTIRPIVFVPVPTNPRFYFADQIASSRDFMTRLSSGSWTPRIAFIDSQWSAAALSGAVLSASQRSNSASLRVRADGDALLVCSITRHKYWHALIDGRPAELIAANVAYQALRVPRGVHEIELRYDNPLVRWFGLVSIAALILVTIVAFNRGPRTEDSMIELSCDLGEASDEKWRAVERDLWTLIDAANVACGGHAGDEESMAEAARFANDRGIVLGAHPSYPDRENFGRRTMSIAPRELRRSLIHQLSSFAAIAARQDVALQRIKAHGALYNDAHRDHALAAVLIDAAKTVDESLSIVASDTSQMALVAREQGLHVIREAFADRRYMPDGSLVSRKDSDALLSIEEAAEQAHLLATRRQVIARDGTPLALEFDTLCIHADTPGAVERAREIRTRLSRLT